MSYANAKIVIANPAAQVKLTIYVDHTLITQHLDMLLARIVRTHQIRLIRLRVSSRMARSGSIRGFEASVVDLGTAEDENAKLNKSTIH